MNAVIQNTDEMELLTARQAGDIIKFDPSTIYRWIRQGMLPVVRINTNIRIRPIDLERFINEHHILPPA